MKQYLDLLQHVRNSGVKKSDRTGTGTLSTFGYQMRFNLEDGFPLVTTKRVPFKAIVHELLWFLKGDTNAKYLNDHGVTIWDEWKDENGDLGPIYGKQWRSWRHTRFYNDGWGWDAHTEKIDQIAQVIQNIKMKPDSRRHIVTAWNPGDLPNELDDPQTNVRNGKMALAPCHCLFQFYVVNQKLSCQLYQRSADVFLGVPFNIASYSLLTIMVAQVCGLLPGEFIHTFGDAHLYLNHIEQADEQLKREPRVLPVVSIAPGIVDISKFTYQDIHLFEYNPHPSIKALISK